MSPRLRFFIACAVSALCLAVAWAVFMLATASSERVSVPRTAYSRLLPVVAAVGLVFQLVYAGALRRMLMPRGLFNLPVLVAAYVFPSVAIGLALSNTTADLLGIGPWALFAFVLASTFWFAARALER